jgi:DNA-binding PadR family transcriptional regulator
MSLRHGLLGLLATAPASGYDLLKRFNGSLAFVWPATQSQLYTELGKLDRAGLVEVTSRGPRGRKDYALTDAGRQELHRWLTETEPDRNQRHENILRVFFLWTVDPAQATAYFEREAELQGELLDELQHVADTADWNETPWMVFGRIALEQGLRVTRANLEWAQWAATAVPAAPAPSTKARRRAP